MGQAANLDIQALAQTLEPMIRQVIREELERVIAERPGVFYLTPGTPLYEDMERIRQEAETGAVKLLSRAEALGD